MSSIIVEPTLPAEVPSKRGAEMQVSIIKDTV